MTTPNQHPASTSDARKRAAENAQEGRGAPNSAPVDQSATDVIPGALRPIRDDVALIVTALNAGRITGADAIAAMSAHMQVRLDAQRETAEADIAAAREALARVEALADEWERNYTSMLIAGFSGASIGADTAAKRIRAALQPATDEGAGA